MNRNKLFFISGNSFHTDAYVRIASLLGSILEGAFQNED